MQLNEDRYSDVEQALKDVLFMFLDAVVQNGDFSELNLGSYDPFNYLVIDVDNDLDWPLTNGEADLLMKGAAIALLSKVADIYFEDECCVGMNKGLFDKTTMYRFIKKTGAVDLPECYSYLPKIYEVFKRNGFINNEYIQNAFNSAFSDDVKFRHDMKKILDFVIKPCFRDLSKYES